MGLIDFFTGKKRKNTATIAKERLQIIVAHERAQASQKAPDFLPALQRDILEVVRRYIPIAADQIKVNVDREHGVEVLELNIMLPEHEIKVPEDRDNTIDQKDTDLDNKTEG